MNRDELCTVSFSLVRGGNVLVLHYPTPKLAQDGLVALRACGCHARLGRDGRIGANSHNDAPEGALADG